MTSHSLKPRDLDKHSRLASSNCSQKHCLNKNGKGNNSLNGTFRQHAFSCHYQQYKQGSTKPKITKNMTDMQPKNREKLKLKPFGFVLICLRRWWWQLNQCCRNVHFKKYCSPPWIRSIGFTVIGLFKKFSSYSRSVAWWEILKGGGGGFQAYFFRQN